MEDLNYGLNVAAKQPLTDKEIVAAKLKLIKHVLTRVPNVTCFSIEIDTMYALPGRLDMQDEEMHHAPITYCFSVVDIQSNGRSADGIKASYEEAVRNNEAMLKKLEAR